MSAFLKVMGWLLVAAGIIAGLMIIGQMADWHGYDLAASVLKQLPDNPYSQADYAAARTAMFSAVSLGVGVGLGSALPGLILVGIGEVVSAVQESTAATVYLLETLTRTQASTANQVAAASENPATQA
jgi:hypothetical protein